MGAHAAALRLNRSLFTKGQFFRLVQIESTYRSDKINSTLKQKFFLEWIENNVGKGEDASFPQHFQCFEKASFSGLLKVGIVCERVNSFPNNKDGWSFTTFQKICLQSELKKSPENVWRQRKKETEKERDCKTSGKRGYSKKGRKGYSKVLRERMKVVQERDMRRKRKCAKGLTLSQTTNFRLFQTERVCRQQF